MSKLHRKVQYSSCIMLCVVLFPGLAFAQGDAVEENSESEASTTADSGADDFDAGIDEPDDVNQEPAPVANDKPVDNKPRKSRMPINFRVTETFISQYVGDNGANSDELLYGDDDNFWLFKNMIYLQASNRYFDSAVRLDLTLFHNPPYSLKDPSSFKPGGSGYTLLNYDNNFRILSIIERMHVTAHIGKLHITAGDFYVSFGRGIALSLMKLDDTGADNSLRGGRIQLKIPRTLRLDIIGGITNALNFDPLTNAAIVDDPMDRIVGARAEWEVMDAFSLGAHGVYLKPRFTKHSEIEENHLWVDQGPGVEAINGGGTFDLHVGRLSMYLEGNGQQHDNYRVPKLTKTMSADPVLNETGLAFFGDVSFDLSPVLIKAEGIYYKQWAMFGPFRGSHTDVLAPPVQYHHMPTLEPLWMVNNSLGNEYGGRYTADLYLRKSDTQFTLTTATIKYLGGLFPEGKWEDHPPTTIIHPILKVRQRFEKTDIMIALEGGYRYEMTDEPAAGHDDNGRLWHAMFDVSVPITGPHSMELKVEVRRHDLNISESLPHWVTLATLGYDMAGLWGMALIHEYSDEVEGTHKKLGNYQLKLPTQHYMWAMLNFHPPAPFDGLAVKFYGGSQRGGLKCAGGVCRVYPDAVGAKLEVVYRF